MSKPSALGAVLYSAESAFAETDDDTTTTRLEVASRVDVSGLVRDTIEAPYTAQLGSGGGFRTVKGPKSGTFTTEHYLTGHGADPAAGALTATDLYTLLKLALGGGSAGGDGGVASGAGTVTAPEHTGATVEDYSPLLIGARGDGRGNGQFHFAESEAAGVITLLTALEAVLAADDAIRPALHVYPATLASSLAAVPGLRFLLQTGDRQYLCRGCYLTGIAWSGANGREVPRLSLTWAPARWTTSAAAFPSTTAADPKTPAPVAGGSLFLSASSAHATYVVRSFSITFEHIVHVIESTCTDSDEQAIAECIRGGTVANIAMVLDYDADLFTHYEDGDELRLLYTLSSEPGRAVGIFCPSLEFTAKPTQVDQGGLNAVSVALRAKPNEAAVASDQTAAPFHILMG